jgi:hypothetical protein
MTMNKPIPTANERPRKRQLSFKKFVVSKRREQRLARSTNSSKAARSKLTEQNVGYATADDSHESIFASIPAHASDREVAIELLADKLREAPHLCLKPTPRLEWRGQDRQDEAEQGEHRPLTLGDSIS